MRTALLHLMEGLRPAGSSRLRAARGRRIWLSLTALLLAFTPMARAQWVSESYPLLPGWNGIWVPHDCSYANLDTLLAGQPLIEEVWLWNPVGGAATFATSPAVPLAPDVAWQVWRRGKPTETTLTKLVGGAAYLVKVGSNPLTLQLTGKPQPPRYSLNSSGLNLVGFPMLTPDSSSTRNVETFFSYDATLKSNPPVFTYRGGALSEVTPKNPVQVTTPRTTALSRGKAYWVNTNGLTRYYGPVEVTILGSTLDFGATLSAVTVRLRNAIDPAKNLPVTVKLAPAASVAPPAGQAEVAGAVPLLVRGPRENNSLDFTYTPLSAAGITRTLAPGEQTEVTLAVDRTAMFGPSGQVFQSLLQVTDSLNLTRIDLGVRAEKPSFTGIWIGSAVVTAVDQTIGQTTVGINPAPSGFPMRLILHRSEAGQVTVLQQVYLGADKDGPIGSTSETAVTSKAEGKVLRFSSASFPPGNGWAATGNLGLSGSVNFQVALDYRAATNPFVHSYHPDHDNLDARFEQLLPEGAESPEITRYIALSFMPSLPGVTDNGFGSTTLGGTWHETIVGLRSVPVSVEGSFVLRRIAPVPALLPP